MTSISKIAYVDKLDDIVNKCKIGIIAQLKWSLLVKNQKYILTLIKKLITKILKFVRLVEYQNIKIFLEKVTLQIVLKKFLGLKKVKNTVLWTYVINDLNGEEIIGTLYKQELLKTSQII